ncbi:hypothetical protein K458DRAFT_410117 [Lentithecium fluviatile CBS 122367]|uniref:Uncharacterized protein n=1 Tax=Lentithecium fluviatile CBS 122367 TaxID=1168545 RepID=A0A6G1IFQ8_9PLEO|nr:hypothetical protein K458DRAFT_410117 [Lentithecium fluviatile CBS 122367]
MSTRNGEDTDQCDAKASNLSENRAHVHGRNGDWETHIDPALAGRQEFGAATAQRIAGDNAGIQTDSTSMSRPVTPGSLHIHGPKPTELPYYPHVENGVLENYRCQPRVPEALVPAHHPPRAVKQNAASNSPSTRSLSDSLSPSPTPQVTSEIANQGRSPGFNLDLIRNAPTPADNDFSANAQIIRTVCCHAGRRVDFTWKDHYHILYTSVVTARITELNGKLAKGLKKETLMRAIDPLSVPEKFRSMVIFTQTGMQTRINWVWCWEHIEILEGMDLMVPELGLETLDSVVKQTGEWMVRRPKKGGRRKSKNWEDLSP